MCRLRGATKWGGQIVPCAAVGLEGSICLGELSWRGVLLVYMLHYVLSVCLGVLFILRLQI